MKTLSKQLTRTAIFASLYVVLTLPLGSLAVQPFIQIRPAESLTILPLIFPSAILGVAVGCFIVNLLTSSILDAVIGGAITLLAGILTSLVGKIIFEKKIFNVLLGGIFPIILNAVGLPVMFLLMGYEIGYVYTFFQILISQSIWIYGLGIPLYYVIKKTSNKNSWEIY